MADYVADAVESEAQFAERVDHLAATPQQHEMLTDLLRENHPVYEQRSGAEIVRMRGWVLLALARCGVTDRALPYLLEEFDAGADPYLVGTAAHALICYPQPDSAFVPFVLRALANTRDESLSFETYGEYSTSPTGPSSVRELLMIFAWLGPKASSALPELASIRESGRLSKRLIRELDLAVDAITM